MQTTDGKDQGFRVFPVLMVLAIILVAAGQAHLLREIRKLRVEVSANKNEMLNSSGTTHNGAREMTPAPRARLNPFGDNQQSPTASIATLEQRVNELARAIQHPTGARAVAEYNVMSPPIGPDEVEPPAEKRGWGEEQIIGPPDTPTASDARSAWASREQDAGPEWLAVDFAHAVDLAEVRIRETYNPGAISKVTGVVNGQEFVLWEGTATGGTAPRDFVVPVHGTLQANSVVVHLDTARVPGWNEIDAVELVGKDGTMQWARSVTASSSYAEGRGSSDRRKLMNEAMPETTR